LSKPVFILLFLFFISIASIATPQVDGKQYKTITEAVKEAHDGSTIRVYPGTYNEHIRLDKSLTLIGIGHPKVKGFDIYGIMKVTIDGFNITYDGVSSPYCGFGIIRNNYFYDCGVHLAGYQAENSVIMDNQFVNGSIVLYDTHSRINITNNTVTDSKVGLSLNEIMSMPTVKNNMFKNCSCAVYFEGWDHDPGTLTTFSDNTYIQNKADLEWGTESPYV
jgi:parallel beta-helix repeat protein